MPTPNETRVAASGYDTGRIRRQVMSNPEACAVADAIEAARHLNERAKVDLAEWYADDGEGEHPDFRYFIDLDAALASLGGTDAS